MAISETTLKDTVLMMVDDLNKKGGLLGKKGEAVVVDPASNWPLFAEKARELLSKRPVDRGKKALLLPRDCASVFSVGFSEDGRSCTLT